MTASFGSGRVATPRLLAYSVTSLASNLVVVPVTAVLPAFWAKNTGATLASIGAVLVASRVFDAVSDQLLGFLSDRTRSRLGARKPWMIAGALVTMLAVAFLFRPGPEATTVDFAVWAFLFYLGWTMINIPYTAWGAELSTDYKERSRIVTYRSVVGSAGGVLFLAAPLLLPFETTEMTAEVLEVVAWAAIGLMPVAIAVTVVGVPTTPSSATQPASLRTLLSSIRGNRPFLRYLAAFVLGAIQLGFYATLLFLFIDSYLGIGDKFSYVMASTAFVAWVSTPLWLRIANRWGKHRPWAFSWAASAAVLFGFWFVEPGPSSFVPTLVISCLYGALGSCSAVTPPSILADVIDYDILKTGEDRAGNYFAFHLLVIKAAVAVSGGLAFILLDLFGFDPQAEVHDATARFGMLFCFVLLPNTLQVLSAWVVWNFPLDERRQRIIRRRLDQRTARAERDRKLAAEVRDLGQGPSPVGAK